MARLTVALDVGSKLVRMAALTTQGKQTTIVALSEQAVLPEEGPQVAIQRLFEGLPSPVDAVIGLFSLQNLSVRTVKLPFADRKKIDQIIEFELEGLFPFDTEDAVFNYFPVSKSAAETELLVGAARKELVASRLEAYRQTGHEPRNLLVDGFALEPVWRASTSAPIAAAGDEEALPTTALLHVGRDEAILLLVRDDGYRLARSFRLGRRELLTRAARVAGRSVEELEAAISDGVSADSLDVLLRPLMREIETTFRSTEKMARVRPGRVVLMGLAAEWPGFADASARALRIPCETLQMDETKLAPGAIASLGDYAPLVGAVLQTVEGGGLDMRAGQFAYTRTIELVRGKLMVTGAFAAILLLLTVAGNAYTYFAKSAEHGRIKAELETVFKEAMPDEPIVDPVQQLEAQVRSLRSQVEGSGGEGVIDTMKAMSASVGSEMAFKISEFHKDTAGFRIRAETDSYENIDAIKNAIGKLPGMKAAVVTDSKTTSTGAIVFELSIEGGSE